MLKKIKNIPDKYCWTVILSSLAIAAGIILYYIPPDMDVFNQYHALACWHYPNSVLHSFREPCDDGLKLKLFGDISWWRSYRYVGATYSMLYYPLFLLWPSRYSVTILCVLVMALGIFAASRLLKIQLWIATLLLAATFPIFFYTIYDYGQLTLQLCLLYALPYWPVK
jgi:hypothetical protein